MSLPVAGMSFALGFVAWVGLGPVGVSAQNGEDATIRVTLMGTGAPPPQRARMGPGTLVEAGSHKLLFDVGRGVTTSIREHGLLLGEVTAVFLTHLHADHVMGIPDLWLTGHHRGPFGQRVSRLRVAGPEGTVRMLRGLEEAYSEVIGYWRLPGDTRFDGHEFSDEGVVFDDDGVTVTAFRVSHSPGSGLDPYGYRVDFGGRSVVISGDTGYSENLVEHARGVDLLVHEVFLASEDSGFDPDFRRRLEITHSTPDVVARVFSEARPVMAVLSHIGADNADVERIEEAILTGYAGRFVMGEDLMTIELGDEVFLRERR